LAAMGTKGCALIVKSVKCNPLRSLAPFSLGMHMCASV